MSRSRNPFAWESQLENLISSCNLVVVRRDATSRYSLVEYGNSHVGLEVTQEHLEHAVLAKIGLPVQGHLHAPPFRITSDTRLTTFWVDDFILLRGSKAQICSLYKPMPTVERVAYYAEAIETCCGNVLVVHFHDWHRIDQAYRKRVGLPPFAGQWD